MNKQIHVHKFAGLAGETMRLAGRRVKCLHVLQWRKQMERSLLPQRLLPLLALIAGCSEAATTEGPVEA
ncbi:hypothetical protein F2Q70_00015077 [Brassica cretica]|uniref:Uncharacterized protein n=1 Tax=Brassica cretica TaxID=69181 RepID=A0A3N6QT85_BRACR|nr:hypothetical protein F2Q70_00015077 [Brassica cretica]